MIKKSDQPVVKSRNENDSPWYSICFKVLTKPSAKTFEELLSSKYATKSIAYVLIFVGSLMIASSTIFIKGIPLLSDNSSELPDYLFNIPFFFCGFRYLLFLFYAEWPELW